MADSKTIPVSKKWAGVDLTPIARNWTQDVTGAQRRMGNQARAVQVCGHAVNHAVARYPRPMFHKMIVARDWDTVGIEPLLRWYYMDSIANGYTFLVHVIYVPRITGTGTGKIEHWTGATSYFVTAPGKITDPNIVETVDRYEDAAHLWFRISRGAATDALATEGLSTFEGFTVACVNVVEERMEALNTDLHSHAQPKLAAKGDSVLEESFETVRGAVQQLRENNLPILIWWSSLGMTSTAAAPGDASGATVSSTSYVNLFDQSASSRDEASPGFPVDVYLAARGPSDEAWGQRIKVQCYVLANATSATTGGDGTIKFEGPLGDTEITVTGGAGLAIYGGAGTSVIYLDSSTAGDDLTADMNKIDILGKVRTAGNVHVYGIYAFVIYE